MARPVTLFTGQFADIPIKELAPMAADWGYDGLELACWGDHFDVEQAVNDPSYCDKQKKILSDCRCSRCRNVLRRNDVMQPDRIKSK